MKHDIMDESQKVCQTRFACLKRYRHYLVYIARQASGFQLRYEGETSQRWMIKPR